MARDISSSLKRIDKNIDSLMANMNSLYQSNYSSRTDNKVSSDSIFGTIEDNLDKILSDINNQNTSDIASLYSRLNKGNNVNTELEDFLTKGGNIIDTINIDNIRKYIQSMDYQIDMICRYMPKLQLALEIMKDNVLSSDSFTKEYVNVLSDRSNTEALNLFNDRAKLIKSKYDVETLYDEIYEKTSKYGEYFLYHVPYTKAFERLLKRKERMSHGIRYESVFNYGNIKDNTLLLESSGSNIKLSEDYTKELSNGNTKVNIVFDESGIIPEPIETIKESYQVLSEHKSVCESFMVSSNLEETSVLQFDDGLSSDGLVAGDRDIKISDKLNGSVLYEIPRADIIPLRMSNTVVGYLHLMVENNYVNSLVLNGGTYNSVTNNTKLVGEELDRQNDLFVSYLATTMAEKINAKFINSNMDLKEQIYSILRHNDKFCCTNGTNNIRISFLPAEDVEHYYFRLDKKTGRGISDLDRAIVPGMIYCLLYLSNVIGKSTREQDKRLYYVKQNVEQNVARTMMNVIAQLKKGNMGMRQLDSMNSIFNIIGKYNDHIIPMSQSGEPPITMEVMQGQQIETPTDLMDRMEEEAIESTDVPLEFVNSIRQVDFATRFSMSNSKFLRKVYKRQAICQRLFSNNFRKLYNFEYKENDTSIHILLPVPAYLAMVNGQQLLDNVKNYVTSLAEIICVGKDDEVKNAYIAKLSRYYLGTYVDFDKIDDMLKSTEIELEVDKDSTMGSEDGSGDEYDSYE